MSPSAAIDLHPGNGVLAVLTRAALCLRRIVMAVARFDRDEVTLTDRPNLLVLAGAKRGADLGPEAEHLHRGIAGRTFERRFELADHVKVANASLEKGLLTSTLQREIPEALKPGRIEIQGNRVAGANARARIETHRAP